MTKTQLIVVALISAAASGTACFFYFILYWPHRSKFDDSGRYFDEATQVVYHEQSGMLAPLAAALFAGAVVLTYFWRKSTPGREKKEGE